MFDSLLKFKYTEGVSTPSRDLLNDADELAGSFVFRVIRSLGLFFFRVNASRKGGLNMAYEFLDEKPPKRLSLKAAIALSGKSQREIAAAIDKHEVILSQIIMGRLVPTKWEVYRIAAALRTHPRELFDELRYDFSDWANYADALGIDYQARRNT